jgi:hypothetical protein
MTNHEYFPGVEDYIRRGEEEIEALSSLRTRMRQMKFDTIAVTGLYGLGAARRVYDN